MKLEAIVPSCFFAIAAPALLPAAPTVDPARPTALVHAVVLDGAGGAPIENGVVIVRGDRVAAIGSADSTPVPRDAAVIDVRGQTVMPGLADMHVHFAHGWDGTSVDLLAYQRYLNAFLYAGVTTILDMGNVPGYILQVRDDVAAGRLLGPRVYCVGPLIDGPDPLWPSFSYGVSSVEQIPGVVQRLKQDRVDALKAYAGLSDRLLRPLAQEAQKNGLPVFVDQSWRNGSIELVMGDGVTTFAHMADPPIATFLTTDAASLMKQRGVRFITTLSVVEYQTRRRLADLAFLGGDLVRQTTTPDVLEHIRAEAERAPDEREQASVRRNLERLKNRMANTKAFFDMGLLLVAGTDAPYPGVFQGEGLHRELELLVEAGLPPLDAITCATRNAARLMGAENEWGTLAAGRVANLIVVDGRPDRRIQDTRNVRMVMLRGRMLDRDKLRLR